MKKPVAVYPNRGPVFAAYTALRRRLLQVLWLLCIGTVTSAVLAQSREAELLRARFASLQEPLQHNQFQRPLVLASSETADRLQGEIHATLAYPFNAVKADLSEPGHWCDVLLLHVNTKYCRAAPGPSGAILRVSIGKKTPQDLADVAHVDFQYRLVTDSADFFAVTLDAPDGPLGTSDYRIRLEVVALPNDQSFLHLTYSYATSFTGRFAMQTYLATLGSGKLGFSVQGVMPDGQPDYIGGVRGVVERNTMRYYLAIDAFLSARRALPEAQFEQRLQTWFAAVERYPRQLHEVDRLAYLEMKRAEQLRQQTLP
jgi:hypothetical protein